jgi:hypothetical protein
MSHLTPNHERMANERMCDLLAQAARERRIATMLRSQPGLLRNMSTLLGQTLIAIGTWLKRAGEATPTVTYPQS